MVRTDRGRKATSPPSVASSSGSSSRTISSVRRACRTGSGIRDRVTVDEAVGGHGHELAVLDGADRRRLERSDRLEVGQREVGEATQLDLRGERRGEPASHIVHLRACRERLDQSIEAGSRLTEFVVRVDRDRAGLRSAGRRVAGVHGVTDVVLDRGHSCVQQSQPGADDGVGEPVVGCADHHTGTQRGGEEPRSHHLIGGNAHHDDEEGEGDPDHETESDHPNRQVLEDTAGQARQDAGPSLRHGDLLQRLSRALLGRRWVHEAPSASLQPSSDMSSGPGVRESDGVEPEGRERVSGGARRPRRRPWSDARYRRDVPVGCRWSRA